MDFVKLYEKSHGVASLAWNSLERDGISLETLNIQEKWRELRLRERNIRDVLDSGIRETIQENPELGLSELAEKATQYFNDLVTISPNRIKREKRKMGLIIPKKKKTNHRRLGDSPDYANCSISEELGPIYYRGHY